MLSYQVESIIKDIPAQPSPWVARRKIPSYKIIFADSTSLFVWQRVFLANVCREHPSTTMCGRGCPSYPILKSLQQVVAGSKAIKTWGNFYLSNLNNCLDRLFSFSLSNYMAVLKCNPHSGAGVNWVHHLRVCRGQPHDSGFWPLAFGLNPVDWCFTWG